MKKRIRDIIILAGGFGKRLKPISQGIPKPLMPVGNRVFLDFVFDWLSQFNVDRIILSLCYNYKFFYIYLKQRNFPFNIMPIVEPCTMGTGGAIKYVLENIEIMEPFGVLNGDTYLDINLEDMAEVFIKLNCNAMIGLSYVNNVRRYGIVSFEGNKAFTFSKKSKTTEGWINNGCYLFKRNVFASCQRKFSVEIDIFPQLVKQKQLYVYPSKGEFFDIGIPEDYYQFIKKKSGIEK